MSKKKLEDAARHNNNNNNNINSNESLFWHILVHANDCSSSVSLVDTIFEGFGSSPEHFRETCVCFLLSTSSPPADISSYGYGQCQLSGAAGLNSGYQSGHSCAKACRGAAPTVGNPARLLLRPPGKECLTTRYLKPFLNVQYVI